MGAVDDLPTGLVAVTGDEGSGKTSWLHRLSGETTAKPYSVSPLPSAHPDALWLDLTLPGQDEARPDQVWEALRARCPRWDPALHAELVEALGLAPHQAKQLFMLSTGSRRKVAIAGLLAAGATVTCLDQPFAALDAGSRRVLREFLEDVADHPSRTWVVADYEADPALPWRQVIRLP